MTGCINTMSFRSSPIPTDDMSFTSGDAVQASPRSAFKQISIPSSSSNNKKDTFSIFSFFDTMCGGSAYTPEPRSYRVKSHDDDDCSILSGGQSPMYIHRNDAFMFSSDEYDDSPRSLRADIFSPTMERREPAFDTTTATTIRKPIFSFPEHDKKKIAHITTTTEDDNRTATTHCTSHDTISSTGSSHCWEESSDMDLNELNKSVSEDWTEMSVGAHSSSICSKKSMHERRWSESKMPNQDQGWAVKRPSSACNNTKVFKRRISGLE